jgi:hypothetical protein
MASFLCGSIPLATNIPYATYPGSRRDKQKRMRAERRCQEGQKVGEFSMRMKGGTGPSIALPSKYILDLKLLDY